MEHKGSGECGETETVQGANVCQKIDVACIQETIKQSFSDRELKNLAGEHFCWRYVAARGHSGGIIFGLRENLYDIMDWDQGVFSLRMVIKNKKDGFTWELINVYGPAQQTDRDAFLRELSDRVNKSVYPILMGGDFNLYRFCSDKTNGVVDIHRMEAFNDFIANCALQEFHRLGGKYTWTNKQLNPIRVVLDRVFASISWEQKHPLTTVCSLLRVGSDHSPILLDTRESENGGGLFF